MADSKERAISAMIADGRDEAIALQTVSGIEAVVDDWRRRRRTPLLDERDIRSAQKALNAIRALSPRVRTVVSLPDEQRRSVARMRLPPFSPDTLLSVASSLAMPGAASGIVECLLPPVDHVEALERGLINAIASAGKPKSESQAFTELYRDCAHVWRRSTSKFPPKTNPAADPDAVPLFKHVVDVLAGTPPGRLREYDTMLDGIRWAEREGAPPEAYIAAHARRAALRPKRNGKPAGNSDRTSH